MLLDVNIALMSPALQDPTLKISSRLAVQLVRLCVPDCCSKSPRKSEIDWEGGRPVSVELTVSICSQNLSLR